MLRAASSAAAASRSPRLLRRHPSPALVPLPPSCLQRYKQLLFYATKLEPFPVEQHNEANKVKGCVSQVGVSQRGLGAGL